LKALNQSRLLSWWPNADQRQIFRHGLRDIFPALVATGAWGFVTGIAMVKSGLTESMATLMTMLVYAGSAQLTSLPLIEASAPIWLIFAAGTVVNLRFIIFGAALFPYFRHLSWPKRLLLGYLTSDIGFVVFMAKYGESRIKGSNEQLWYFIGLIAPGWLGWITCSLLGVYLGGVVPERWSLEFAAILALMAIIIPLVKNRPMIVCCAIAGVIAWLGQSLPLRLGLIAAVVSGVVAGVAAERLGRRGRGRT
jgi:predicted branched-subunit amino acid permease